MLAIDLLLLVCFIPAVFKGLSKGLVKQVVALLSIFVGAWCAFHFSALLTDWLSTFVHGNRQTLQIASFIIIVIAVILVLTVIGNLIAGALRIASLGWLDKVLGLVFAILKTAMLLGLGIMVFEAINSAYSLVAPENLEDGKVYKLLKDFGAFVFPYLKNLVANA